MSLYNLLSILYFAWVELLGPPPIAALPLW